MSGTSRIDRVSTRGLLLKLTVKITQKRTLLQFLQSLDILNGAPDIDQCRQMKRE